MAALFSAFLSGAGLSAVAQPLSERIAQSVREGQKDSSALMERLLGPDHPLTIRAWHNAGVEQADRGDYAAAYRSSAHALSIAERTGRGERPETVVIRRDVAYFLRRLDRTDEAEALFRRNFNDQSRLLGSDAPETLNAAYWLAQTLTDLWRLNEAESLFRQIFDSRERRLGPDHSDTAMARGELGTLLMKRGRFAEAIAMLEANLAVRRPTLPSGHPLLGLSLNDLAYALMLGDQPAAALPLYDEALVQARQTAASDPLGLVVTLKNAGTVRRLMGRATEAVPLVDEALERFEALTNPTRTQTINILMDIAGFYDEIGQFVIADGLFRRLLALQPPAAMPTPDDARLRGNVALHKIRGGQYAEALPLLEWAIAVGGHSLGDGHPGVILYRANLASALAFLGRNDEAEAGYRAALRDLEAALGHDHPDRLRLLTSLTLVLLKKNDFDKADPVTAETVAAFEARPETDRLAYAQALHYRAVVLRQYGQMDAAAGLWGKSMEVVLAAAGPDHPAMAYGLVGLATLDYGAGRHREALDRVRRAEALLDTQRVARLRAGNLSVDNVTREALEIHILAAAMVESSERDADTRRAYRNEAFQSGQRLIRSSSAAALDLGIERLTAASPEEAAGIRRHQLAEVELRALDQRLLTWPEDREGESYRSLYEQRRRLQAALRDAEAASPGSAPSTAEAFPLVDSHRIGALLARDEAMVVFLPTTEYLVVWIIRQQGIQQQFHRIAAAEVETLVGTLLDSVTPPPLAIRGAVPLDPAKPGRRFDTAVARSLYDVLWKGVEPLLDGVAHVVVVPVGRLLEVPFHALLVEPPARPVTRPEDYRSLHWLLRDRALSVLPSPATLVALRGLVTPRPDGSPFAGFGAAEPSHGLAPLPEAADELLTIARKRHADDGTVFTGPKANEGRVRSMDLSRVGVLAFATHAVRADDLPGIAEPALILSPEQGDNRFDGVLTASEIMRLNLNADWVILSACSTAAPSGPPGTEALSGLGGAFLFAGARSLLVSHWPVVSGAAVSLTTRTLEILEQEPQTARAEALRRSMLHYLENGPDPSPWVWAPFFVAGEGGRLDRASVKGP
ncbi:CHAT domain-containing protein [Azospirillum sp.]|uniref:CHAT domain-containing protein n=1 Tax=Azospirillum sp. TaxID=34012 RepID=UPI00260E4358|nr:CHAT domain-containing protein [Azospirillum sp.]